MRFTDIVKNVFEYKSFPLLLVLLVPCLATAQVDTAEGPALNSKRAIYIPLKPPFVVNYGGIGHLQYLKADISVRVEDVDAANSVRHHMPYIRNNLVLLLSRQTSEDMETQEGRELLRLAALEEIRGILESEDGRSGVVDLYFNNFIVQK